MLKNLVKNSFWIAIAFFCAMCTSYSQVYGPTAQNPFPAGSALINIAPDADGHLTMGGEYKQPKNVVEQEKPVCWEWYADVGYWTEYNFRGVDLTPNSDGSIFGNLDVSKWGFTLGIFVDHQFGTAEAAARSISEGGGAGVQSGSLGLAVPKTFQNRFDELDVYLQYEAKLGWVDITVGDIGFFILRDAQTFVAYPQFAELLRELGFRDVSNKWGPFRTVEDEQFDRLFIRLATSKIPYITPWITYYQGIYSEGQDPFHHRAPNLGMNPDHAPDVTYSGFLRNPETYGGYLEGRLRGHVPIGQWLDFNPFAVISYSFRDRMRPVDNPQNNEDYLRGRPLTGWNVAQVGLELPIHLFHIVGYSSGPCAPPDVHGSLVPFFTYSYHISDPTPGTNRNEVWGGAKFAITF
ncbi:MAG: hypothetical protein DME79_06175 [Verrucomicrobia bacterium]|nr:MAG: hypothetical protein DME79_06175 [Verrucomicrobiota bacterium]PYJ53547.1 MAG: hypothetical protein DME82_13765 [Verrucomicrobiota bacterium]